MVGQLCLSKCQTPRGGVILQKPTVIDLVKKFPTFYETKKKGFITVFTRARHWSLSWGTWIQSTYHTSLIFILILTYIYASVFLGLPMERVSRYGG